MLDHGGFSTTARVLFAGLSALAAAAAVWAGGRPAARAALHPFAAVLIVLAGLGALSSIWTAGLPESALEWALLPAGYGLLAAAVIAAAAADSRPVIATVLATICGCAFVSGVVGLIGAATFSEPRAFLLNDVWRPAGTLEYPPALVLLEVCALAPLLRALCGEGVRARIKLAAAAALGTAGAVLGLSNSRLGLAMALVVLAGCVVAAPSALGAPRLRVLRGVALVVLAGVVARVALGGVVRAGSGSEDWRVGIVIAICVLSPLVWTMLNRPVERASRTSFAFGAGALLAAVCVAISLAPGASERAPVAGKFQAHSVHRDALHGRGQIWSAGLDAFARRPLQGYGAGAFLTATADLQHPVITAYGHDLPLEFGVELGVAGALLGLALYVLVARAWWRARATPQAWLLVLPALVFLTANLVDWPWHIAGIGAVWAAATGALIAAGRGISSPPSDTVAAPRVVRTLTERCT